MGFVGSKYLYDGDDDEMLQHLYEGAIVERQIALTAGIAGGGDRAAFSMCCCFSKNWVSSSREVKKTLRRMIYKKLLRLGSSYKEQANTSEVVQVAVEGGESVGNLFRLVSAAAFMQCWLL